MATPVLKIIGEKVLHIRSNPGLLAYSPSIDLVAVGFTDESIHVFRLNGQPVQHVDRKEKPTHVDHLTWKSSGGLLATASSDGSIDMYSVEGFKVVHSFTVLQENEQAVVTCLAWASNSKLGLSTSKAVQRLESSWKQMLGDVQDAPALDLPRDLGALDVEMSLPKLSTLPLGSADGLFDSRESLDSLFKACTTQPSNIVDILLIATDNGQLAIRIFDTFTIGTFTVPSLPGHSGAISTVISHAAHKNYSSHALLVQSGRKLSFVALDLRFVCAPSGYIALLASKATTLQNLFRYINQVQQLITSQFETSQDLPNRFLSSVNEELVKNNRPSIMPAMYHSVATGHAFPEVKEWLVDELRERGHTRWDKAVTTGLTAVMTLVHENMLPALERYSEILSRFAGIATFQRDGATGLAIKDIRRLMELVECLKLVFHKIMIYASNELDLFSAFSMWLGHEIERLSSTNPADSDKFADKEAAMDYSKILRYIEMFTKGNMVAPFLQQDAEVGEVPCYETVAEQVQNHDLEVPNSLAPMCRVSVLCKNIDHHAQQVFCQIAEAEKRNVSFGQYVELEPKTQDMINIMRIVPGDEINCSAFIISGTTGGHTLQCVEIALKILNGTSNVHFKRTATCDLGRGTILDIAYLSDDLALVLWMEDDGVASIMRIRYRSGGDLEYNEHTKDRVSLLERTDRSYRLPKTENFEPATLEVRGMTENHREEDSVRICIMNRLRSAYKVYALPSSPRAGTEGGVDVTMA